MACGLTLCPSATAVGDLVPEKSNCLALRAEGEEIWTGSHATTRMNVTSQPIGT